MSAVADIILLYQLSGPVEISLEDLGFYIPASVTSIRKLELEQQECGYQIGLIKSNLLEICQCHMYKA